MPPRDVSTSWNMSKNLLPRPQTAEGVCDVAVFRTSNTICKLNVVLLISKHKRSYWKSSSGFNFVHITTISISISILLTNFMEIGPPSAELSCRFSRRRPQRWSFTLVFRYGNRCCLDEVKVYLTIKFRRNNSIHCWHIKANVFKFFFSGFDLNHITIIGMLFCISLQNFIQIGPFAAEIWHHGFSIGLQRPSAMLDLQWDNSLTHSLLRLTSWGS